MASYMKQYSLLVVTAKADRANRNVDSWLYANHHIFAISQSEVRGDLQDNRLSNIARLTHAEHYEAHRLLHLLYPKHYGLGYAYYKMSHEGDFKVDVEAYATARGLHSIATSEFMKSDRNPMKSEVNRKSMSTDRNPAKSESNRKRMCETNPGSLEKNRLIASELSKVRKVCEHCGLETGSLANNKHHGGKCQSLTSYVIATHLVTGDTIQFKTMALAETGLSLGHVKEVVEGSRKQSKGWHFVQVIIDQDNDLSSLDLPVTLSNFVEL